MGRDLCGLGPFRTWGGGGAGGAASWYSAYPCSHHPVGCLAPSARIAGLLRVGPGPISPCIPSPRVALWPTPSSPQPASGGLARGEGHSMGWVQWFCICPFEAPSEKTCMVRLESELDSQASGLFRPTPAAFIAVFKSRPPKLSGMLSSAPGRGPPIRACKQEQQLAQRHWPWSTFSQPHPRVGWDLAEPGCSSLSSRQP